MESIHTIAHVRPATQDQIASTKSISVIQIHAATEAPVQIITTIIRVTVHMVSLAKIVPSTWIGAHKIHVKMVLRVHNTKTHTNVIV